MTRPRFESVPLAVGLRWRGGGGWLYQEKADGRWCDSLALGHHVLVAEQMRGGRFVVHDIRVISGAPVAGMPLRERWLALQAISRQFPPHLSLVATGNGGEFLEYILAQGGEGVVAKHLSSFYGESGAWVKCKRVETFDCLITAVHPAKLSVRLALDGQDVGWCGCTSSQLKKLALGDVVEVAAHSRHPSGKLREPRFVKFRPDKEHNDDTQLR